MSDIVKLRSGRCQAAYREDEVQVLIPGTSTPLRRLHDDKVRLVFVTAAFGI
jgi:hypothetical protein